MPPAASGVASAGAGVCPRAGAAAAAVNGNGVGSAIDASSNGAGIGATVGRVMISEIPLIGFSFRVVFLATSTASSCGQMP
ncbi:MAG: hypothetical protein IPO80_04965 [Propionibacteriaceae bacterium]|nr:hypothetical protein [Propionibacteriaceae bacterium]